jgi:hypothetical protein
MAIENRVSEGALVTYENCTALSNIAAGTPVALVSAAAAGGGTIVTTLGETVAGMSSTALLGYHFIGVLDEAISANQTDITVWTKGVFQFDTSTSSLDANFVIGNPVWADSGTTVLVGAGTGTGDLAIGTIVGFNTGAAAATGLDVLVKINPGVYRWGIWNEGIAAATSASAPESLCWPKQGA